MVIAMAFELATLEGLFNGIKHNVKALRQHMGCLDEIPYYLNQKILSINFAAFMD